MPRRQCRGCAGRRSWRACSRAPGFFFHVAVGDALEGGVCGLAAPQGVYALRHQIVPLGPLAPVCDQAGAGNAGGVDVDALSVNAVAPEGPAVLADKDGVGLISPMPVGCAVVSGGG